MRRLLRVAAAALAALVVTGCLSSPAGVPVESCTPDWEAHVTQAPRGFTRDPAPVAVECWRRGEGRILEVGFVMPAAGGDCRAVDRVELTEDSGAVAVTVMIGGVGSDVSGICPDEDQPWIVPVELRSELGDRVVLDASQAG